MNMKKVVIFGGGTGLSQLLKGLKLFPIDITAVVYCSTTVVACRVDLITLPLDTNACSVVVTN